MTKRNRKFYRSLSLSIAALALLIWSAADQFGISTDALATLFYGTVWVAAGIIIAAALVAALWVGLRTWRQRKQS